MHACMHPSPKNVFVKNELKTLQQYFVQFLYVRQKQEKIALHGHKLLYYLIILIL